MLCVRIQATNLLGWMQSFRKKEGRFQKRLKLSIKTMLCTVQADWSHV